MTRICDNCGAPYSRPPSLIGKFCSPVCAYAGIKKRPRKHRQIRRQPDHPLATARGYVSEARAVLYDKVGPGPHECHWCGRSIEWRIGRRGNITDSVIADHLDSNPLDDSPENLVAACGDCNAHRGREVRDDETYRVRANGTRLRGKERKCEGCREPFVAWQSDTRFCSRSCARKAPRVRR